MRLANNTDNKKGGKICYSENVRVFVFIFHNLFLNINGKPVLVNLVNSYLYLKETK
jgi:hypothetical protein